MQWGQYRRAACAPAFVQSRIVLVMCAALALAGCNTNGSPTALLGTPRGASVAFDSIDGPPPELFRKLVQNLNDEAQIRHLPVVSRETQSAYRVRGYLATRSERGRVSVSWLWDVYDGDKNRAQRISGTQTLPGNHRNAWSALDDATLQHIAQTSMDQLAAFLTSPEVAPEAPTPAVVYANDTSPEASGIFRIFRANADPAPVAEPSEESEASPQLAVPLPPYRPKTAAAAAGFTVASAPR